MSNLLLLNKPDYPTYILPRLFPDLIPKLKQANNAHKIK